MTKIREESSPNRHGLLFKIDLPEIKDGVRPIRRMMSAFEQRREIPNRAIQYLLVSPYHCWAHALSLRRSHSASPSPEHARSQPPCCLLCPASQAHIQVADYFLFPIFVQIAAEPYETISFAIPAREIVSEDSDESFDANATWDHWDNDTKTYHVQLIFNS